MYFGPFGFNPHSPVARPAFADLHSGADMIFDNFNFHVSRWGTHNLTDPRHLATIAPESPSTAGGAPSSTASPRSASAPLDSPDEAEEEVESASQYDSDEPRVQLDDYFDSDSSTDNGNNGDRGKISHNIPHHVCVVIENGTDPETSEAAARRAPPMYPWTVTMPDGTTTLVITEEMATKAKKAIDECLIMPEDSTREELATYQYLMWQENLRLKNYRATLDERRRQASM